MRFRNLWIRTIVLCLLNVPTAFAEDCNDSARKYSDAKINQTLCDEDYRYGPFQYNDPRQLGPELSLAGYVTSQGGSGISIDGQVNPAQFFEVRESRDLQAPYSRDRFLTYRSAFGLYGRFDGNIADKKIDRVEGVLKVPFLMGWENASSSENHTAYDSAAVTVNGIAFKNNRLGIGGIGVGISLIPNIRIDNVGLGRIGDVELLGCLSVATNVYAGTFTNQDDSGHLWLDYTKLRGCLKLKGKNWTLRNDVIFNGSIADMKDASGDHGVLHSFDVSNQLAIRRNGIPVEGFVKIEHEHANPAHSKTDENNTNVFVGVSVR